MPKVVVGVLIAMALFVASLAAPSLGVGSPDAQLSMSSQLIPDSVESLVTIDAADAGWWGCAGAVAAFVASNAVFASKIAKLGGAWKAAKKIRTAAKVIKRYGWAWNSARATSYLGQAVLAGLGEISGITNVVKKCA